MEKRKSVAERFGQILCAAILILLAATATPQDVWGSGKSIELILNSMFASGTAQHMHLERWAEKIKTDSNEKLTIRIFPGAILSPVPEIYSATGKGVSDLGYGFKYKGSELFDPLDGFMAESPNIETTASVYNDLWNEYPEYRKEFEKTKVLWFGYTGPSKLHTVKPVRSLSDLKGMQVRSTTISIGRILNALGAVGVQVPTSELAIGLQKGMLQGVTTPEDQLKSFRLADYVNFTTEMPLYTPYPNFMVMNIDKYNSLSPELAQVIDNSLEWAKQDCLNMWKETDTLGRDYANSKGHQFISLSSVEKAKWLIQIRLTQDEIAKEIDAKGYPGTKMLQFIRDRIAQYAK